MKLSNLMKMTMPTVILGWALSGSSAWAGNCPLIPDGTANMEDSDAADLFSDGKFAQVEAALEKRHRKNLASEGGDLLTLRNIDAMVQISGQQENLIRMWADQRPQSFFSQFTAGMYYADKSGNMFGGRPLSQAGQGELNQSRKLAGMAIGYLQKAMQLDPHSALPQGMMLNIACVQGQAAGKNAQQWLQAANQVDPKNLFARIQATQFLSPRWCGSFQILDQMVQQAAKSLSAQAEHYLAYNVVLAKASHEEIIAQDKAKANAFYKQAKGMCENSEKAQQGVIRTYQ
jgi:hypothetical protein